MNRVKKKIGRLFLIAALCVVGAGILPARLEGADVVETCWSFRAGESQWQVWPEAGLVRVVDATSGKPKWSETGTVFRRQWYDMALPTDARAVKPGLFGIVHGRVYLLLPKSPGKDGSNTLLAFDPDAQGRLVWRHDSDSIAPGARFVSAPREVDPRSDILAVDIRLEKEIATLRIDAATGMMEGTMPASELE